MAPEATGELYFMSSNGGLHYSRVAITKSDTVLILFHILVG